MTKVEGKFIFTEEELLTFTKQWFDKGVNTAISFAYLADDSFFGTEAAHDEEEIQKDRKEFLTILKQQLNEQ